MPVRQILDGLSSGVYAVLCVLVTEELTRGSGRFNFVFGMVNTAHAVGDALSNLVGQSIADASDYEIAFFFLALCSVVPVLLYLFGLKQPMDKSEEDRVRGGSGRGSGRYSDHHSGLQYITSDHSGEQYAYNRTNKASHVNHNHTSEEDDVVVVHLGGEGSAGGRSAIDLAHGGHGSGGGGGAGHLPTSIQDQSRVVNIHDAVTSPLVAPHTLADIYNQTAATAGHGSSTGETNASNTVSSNKATHGSAPGALAASL